MIERFISILQLPEKCLVKKKITKAFFKRNFELTSSEKTILDDFSTVAGIDWIASISPVNANIPAFTESDSTCEELQVIALQTSNDQYERNKIKLADLIQKFVPYHILLIIYCEDLFMFNLCLKRINLTDPNKRVMDKSFYTENISYVSEENKIEAFFNGLSFASLDKTNLQTVYDSYIQQVIALKTVEIKGQYTPRTNERTKQDVQHLEEIGAIEKELGLLQNLAKKETQMNRRIELNTQIQQKRKAIELLKQLITN